MVTFNKAKIWPLFLFTNVGESYLSDLSGFAHKQNILSSVASDTRLDVNLNVGFTLTHGGDVFELGSTGTKINSNNEDSCNVLKLVQTHLDKPNEGRKSEEINTIIKHLTTSLCKEKHEEEDIRTVEEVSLVSMDSAVVSPTNSQLTKNTFWLDTFTKKSFPYNEKGNFVGDLSSHPRYGFYGGTNLLPTRRLDDNIFEVYICDYKPLLVGDEKVSSLYPIFMAISTADSLSDNTSPQYQAACWIMFDDVFQHSQDDCLSQLEIVQRYILAVLYFSTSSTKHWRTDIGSSPACTWDGVDCNIETKITKISRPESYLKGKIPRELGHFDALELLDLSYNELSGTIPETLGMISSLKILKLSNNALSGKIPPRLFNATEIVELHLSSNELTGTLPHDIGNMKYANALILGHNFLTGAIPEEVWNLSTLKRIFFGFNSFSSTISDSIENLQNLTHLWLQENDLEGKIPDVLGTLSNVRTISLVGNNFSGTIPSTLSNLLKLGSLSLQLNSLTGSMPDGICKNKNKYGNIVVLESDCHDDIFEPPVNCSCCTKCQNTTPVMEGPCPDNKVEIYFPIISGFRFDTRSSIDVTWYLDDLTSNLTGITLGDNLSAEKNKMYRKCIASTDCFEFFLTTSHFNHFEYAYTIKVNDIIIAENSTKIIRPNASTSSYEHEVHFGFNSESGNIEKDSCDAINDICEVRIRDFPIASNIYRHAIKASGKSVVDDITSAQNKVTCYLISLNGFDPEEFDQFYAIALLHKVFGHNVYDEVHSTKKECSWHGVICDSDNKIVSINMTGIPAYNSTIPSELGLLPYLEKLDLSHTQLSGQIPESFINLWSLVHLDLSNNELVGTIPQMPPRLEILDISHNYLTGIVSSSVSSEVKLKKLLLHSNKFTGIERLTYFQTPDLEVIDLHNNLLRGELGSVSNLKKLITFDVSRNYLTGTLPDGLFSIPSLTHINASMNSFNGRIQSANWNDSNILSLDFSQNELENTIPASLFNSKTMKTMILSGNKLTGTLPADPSSISLESLESLEVVSFSYNKLSGKIPRLRQGISRALFHGNQFEGEAPEITNAYYVTDCGVPSSVINPVICKSCNVCCNSLGKCQKKAQLRQYSWSHSILIFFVGSTVLLILLYVGGRLIPQRILTKYAIADADAVSTIGEESVYVFLLSKNTVAWFTATFCAIFQVSIMFLFVDAVNVQKNGNDWEYTMSCPVFQLECTDGKIVTTHGYALFAIVMAAWISNDLISSMKLLILAFKRRSLDLLMGVLVLFGLSAVVVWASVLYNQAIATTNTQLIVNAVILLFVTELDERVYQIAVLMNPNWVEKVKGQAIGIFADENGAGAISSLAEQIKLVAVGGHGTRSNRNHVLDDSLKSEETSQ